MSSTSALNSFTAIASAVANGDLEHIQRLLLQGTELNISDEDGNTVLHIAAHTCDNTDMIEVLANVGGVDIDARNVNGWTPVYAAACGSTDDPYEIIKVLGGLGADVNILSNNDWSPLLMATQKGHFHSVKMLIHFGADVNITNSGGMTPLFLAACLRNWGICQLLVDEGADIVKFIGMPLPENIVHEMLNRFCSDIATTLENKVEIYPLFSIVKLMSSALPASHDPHDKEQFEAEIAVAFQTFTSVDTIEQIHQSEYSLKRVLFRIAWRVYSHSPPIKTNSMLLTSNPRQYVQLVCLFLNESMLTEVFALRLTSKSSHYRQRFPVTCLTHYQELEARMIESFIAYEPSHLVPSSLFQRLIGIHRMDNVSKHMVEINEVLET